MTVLSIDRRHRLTSPHQPRRRRDCLGELVQIDGSEHAWFEDRGERVRAAGIRGRRHEPVDAVAVRSPNNNQEAPGMPMKSQPSRREVATALAGRPV